MIDNVPQTEGLAKKAFYKLVRRITSRDDSMLKAIDYVSAILVTEPIEILQ